MADANIICFVILVECNRLVNDLIVNLYVILYSFSISSCT